MFVVAWITKLLIGRKVSPAAAGPIAWAITIAGAALLVWGGWALVKQQIIRSHDAGQQADILKKQLERTNTADSIDTKLEHRDDLKDDAVKGAIDDAVQKDPNRGSTSVGPVSNAAADELRRGRRERSPPSD